MSVLTQHEVDALLRALNKTLDMLALSGLKKRKARNRVQTDPYDVWERRSAACPYEQLRARLYMLRHPAFTGDGWYHVTGGNSKLRVPLAEIQDVRPEATFGKVRRALLALRRSGLEVEAVYVFELVAVRYIDGREELEPHFHVLIRGATPDQLKAAFAFRKSAGIVGRKRALNVIAVYDLAGLLDYLTKFEAHVRVQYVDGNSTNWKTNSLRGSELVEWTRFMSKFSVADLLKFRGIDGKDLRLAGRAELSLPRPMGPARSPLRPSGRP